MKEIRTQQKYKCGFCSKTGVKHTIEKHEKICFKNPNRYCPECDNTGKVEVEMGDYYTEKRDCPYCSQYDPEKL